MTHSVANPDTDHSLTQSYGEPNGVHDEMKNAEGGVRPAWEGLAGRLDVLGADELGRRWSHGQRMIQDNGVTYNVYGDPRGMDRPWQLDPVPMIVGAEEWAMIEAGLIQRAKLLNAVCADLYGPQKLLKSGQLPAELIMGHPGFLRPCHNLKVPKQRYLSFYGVDLARSPEGKWWVLNDRTQATSGAGYALENRLVISRTLPGVFRDCQVTRHARFFARWRETLRAMSPRVGDNPRIVLLTPGPFNETFFEHAYLARYLGFTLAQGDDLTVRDNKVFLKTLGGLRRVDVILRRLDDSYCDPLELRGDSAIGVPGLVQAAWAGNVTIANALGTGLLETPGLMPFYPGLCKKLLGEEEKLPSLATWWCGQPKELDYVLKYLHELVIKPAYPGAPARGLGGVHIDAIFGDQLTEDQGKQIAELIRSRPEAFAAQENVNISTTPVWRDGKLEPRHMILRAYVAACDDEPGYVVMPGGLTRVSNTADSRVTSMQRGGGSKDTWIISDGPVSNFSLLSGDASASATALANDSFDLPSRVADNLYWLGRYVERTEGLVRLLRAIMERLTDDAQPDDRPELIALVNALDTVSENHAEEDDSVESRILSAMFNPEVSSGLYQTLANARRLASTARDRISLDTWRIVSQLGRDYQEITGPIAVPSEGKDDEEAWQPPITELGDAMELLDQMIITLAAFTGLGTESMLRNQGWRFLDMGRRLERALNHAELLRLLAVSPLDNEGLTLDALLEVMASAMSYRQRYLAVPSALTTLDMLLLDETNPRSVAYQVAQLSEHLDRLPRPSTPDTRLTEDQRRVLDMLTGLRLADPGWLAMVNMQSQRDALSEYLTGLTDQLPQLSDAIARQFLSHNAVSTRLGSTTRKPAEYAEPDRLDKVNQEGA
ncbi:circularly permuted type 2 ATP-grasp protein [Algisphaera agarilytica]|uniref:Putative circularly permuted ATP-grasp superfamily protein/putative alpha-E superfamily protein n=1 Tax=Algisphaera agarilytica TaxID=1385975 RepID=A0A7X0H9H2_9BACT|nr:circularly permuted type 2 ATP-grasp protein [Algisphaera agarilytica]MBB6431738.1 putative circularly permuted ATP-grasp superfamily protein/putative alpha-E superfamily protein [Algisphaera agarilytica]